MKNNYVKKISLIFFFNLKKRKEFALKTINKTKQNQKED